jgi:hypothetical protein
MTTEIYRGKYYAKPRMKRQLKVVAFDLDETLGSFTDLDILWKGICDFCKNPPPPFLPTDLLDLFPEFLRYGILPLLEFLYEKKREKLCHKLYIYTNNQCSPTWTDMIAAYLNQKVNPEIDPPLFDQTICAFKIGDKVVELARTTHAKTHPDFIRCTLLPKDTEICFVDNSYYPDMKRNCIYYIQPAAYYHTLSTDDIIQRFVTSSLGRALLTTSAYVGLFRSFIHTEFYKQAAIHPGYCSKEKLKMDIMVAQKMMFHLQEFFYYTKRRHYTRKKKGYAYNTTRKLRRGLFCK